MGLPALVAAMLRPEMYPHRPAEVTLVQTHISYVCIAGSEVYKIKKPVRFSFLDFSTLAQRHHFCREEVRLNRRLAPDVYLGIVAICPADTGYRLGDESDPAAVEYAVHMRRLPDDRMLDRLLAAGAATAEMIDQLALRLAEFHRQADAGPEVIANGDPAAIARVLEDNFTGMQRFRDVTIVAADDDLIQAFSRAFLQENATLLHQRQAQRRIRDGHGDLHSEHICFADSLVIFDCIEFNRAFRYCDVASEIAFVAMDLDYHERPDLTARLIRSYAAHAQDPELPRLVPFYQCERAYVRGKVDSLKSVEEEVGEPERLAAQQSARAHFALAYRYTWAYTPCVVVVMGLSGTGKSAVADALRRRTGFLHLNSDVVRKRLAGLTPDTRGDATLYTPERSAQTYAALLHAAADHVAGGGGVIVDATFQRRSDRQQVRALAASHGVPLLCVECQCSEAEVRRRLALRERQRDSPSDADWSVYLEQRRRYEPLTPAEEADALRLDTTAAVAHNVAAIERALRSRAQRHAGH